MISPQVFSVLRISPAGDQHILTLTNVTPRPCQVKIPLSELGVQETQWYGLFGRRGWMAQDQILNIHLQPYDVVWLIPFGELERNTEAA